MTDVRAGGKETKGAREALDRAEAREVLREWSVVVVTNSLGDTRCEHEADGKNVWKGLHFEDGTWDRSDLFAPLGTALFFATSKVKAVLAREKATKIKLEPVSEVVRPILL